MTLHGIASRLSPEYEAQVREVWTLLGDRCGLNGIFKTPIPHFSWIVGEGFDFENLDRELGDYARTQPPFTLRTTGLGVFTGPEDIILYIAIIKDDLLAGAHRRIWDLAAPYIRDPAAYYAPANWVPHITLAHGDTDPEALACAARLLARTDLHWTFPVTELSLVFQDETRAEEYARYPFV